MSGQCSPVPGVEGWLETNTSRASTNVEKSMETEVKGKGEIEHKEKGEGEERGKDGCSVGLPLCWIISSDDMYCDIGDMSQ